MHGYHVEVTPGKVRSIGCASETDPSPMAYRLRPVSRLHIGLMALMHKWRRVSAFQGDVRSIRELRCSETCQGVL